jgi:6,7-dimethyl-8-ribityllumazine synthase
MAEHLANAFIRPEKKAHLLIIEARFHDALADALAGGRQARHQRSWHCTYDVVTVPGALEIPAVISFALDVAEAEGGTAYDGFVALGHGHPRRYLSFRYRRQRIEPRP